jgi:dTDP-4-dehydrorhamnose 3,5-epimerase
VQVLPTTLSGLLLIEPRSFHDDRGFFFESWNSRLFDEATGQEAGFVQDNHSGSKGRVLRGLHYQVPPQSQGKLVRVVSGVVFDVAVDIRRSSSTFGQWFGAELTVENRRQLWIPPGFAHGFLVTSDWAELLYKTTDYYSPELDRSIRWDDPDIGIDWPIDGQPILSEKDATAPLLRDAEVFS